jgi:tRNA (guanine-N7-)-methyltransferase
MAQKKLQRFGEIKTFPNVLEYPPHMAGNWRAFFRNEHPVILELACGKGEYATGLAQLYPQKNFIGVDIKGNRIWAGAKFALEHGLGNVAFLRTQIHQVDQYFAAREVQEIWITFPDPQLRGSKAKKRLLHPRFLRLYQKFLQPSGNIHLKTDSPELYNFTKSVIEIYGLGVTRDIDNIYAEKDLSEELKIITHYEKLDIAKSNRVFYLCITLPEKISTSDDELERILQINTHEKQGR